MLTRHSKKDSPVFVLPIKYKSINQKNRSIIQLFFATLSMNFTTKNSSQWVVMTSW
jgi:hypothetical protein